MSRRDPGDDPMRRTLVDLRMARTYVPACVSLFKTTCLILVVAHIHADDHRLPAILLFLCVPLYVDRVVCEEKIFDCNSMMCTLHCSYIVNAMRHILGRGLFFAAASPQLQPGDLVSIQPSSNRSLLGSYHMHWQETGGGPVEDDVIASSIVSCACILLCGVSIALLSDGDLCRYGNLQTRGVFVRSSSAALVMQSVLLGLYVQTPLFEEDKPSSGELVVRSYLFVVLCLGWTYVVGIRHMVILLSTCTRFQSVCTVCTKGGKLSSYTNVVQAFYPCQLRFAVILFLGRWQHILFFLVAGSIICVRAFFLSRAAEQDTHPDYSCGLSLVEVRAEQGLSDDKSSECQVVAPRCLWLEGDQSWSENPWIGSGTGSNQLPTLYTSETFQRSSQSVQIAKAMIHTSLSNRSSSCSRSHGDSLILPLDGDEEVGVRRVSVQGFVQDKSDTGSELSISDDVQEMFKRAAAAAAHGTVGSSSRR